jgi:multidrug efflux pump subunit AcrA (membrane-fusion protein)
MVERLLVRGSAHGLLQDVLVELGQWVVPGTAVAKVIVSRRLQAELRIPAEQAGGIRVGQPAQIRTGYGSSKDATLAGRVRRVAPAASQGTVEVEVALESEPPEGVRPDQNVEGSIEIERIVSTLHLPRPVGLALGDTSRFFRIDPITHVASPVLARTGRVSVDSVEILSGLGEGDEVILSDTARFSNESALRLE